MKKRLSAACLGALILLFAWFMAARFVGIPVVPSPFAVMEKVGDIFFSAIAVHIAYSFGRILARLLLAVIIGLPLGVMMGCSPMADRLLAPIVYLTYPVPKIALLPIVMLLFGLGDGFKQFIGGKQMPERICRFVNGNGEPVGTTQTVN